MSKELNKYIDIEERKFCIQKFSAREGLKTARLIIAKLLPIFETFILPAQVAQLKDGEIDIKNIGEFLNVDNIIKALELISDQDLDTLIDRSLTNCYEALPAGNAKVLNENGTYGVEGIEYDYILTLRLVAESLIWSVGGFFDADRLTSLMGGIKGMDSLLPNA